MLGIGHDDYAIQHEVLAHLRVREQAPYDLARADQVRYLQQHPLYCLPPLRKSAQYPDEVIGIALNDRHAPASSATGEWLQELDFSAAGQPGENRNANPGEHAMLRQL